ncbi:MAG: hypothetical protein AB7K37_06615 [Cyclobacteriaceae bacterium]
MALHSSILKTQYSILNTNDYGVALTVNGSDSYELESETAADTFEFDGFVLMNQSFPCYSFSADCLYQGEFYRLEFERM